MKKAVIIITLTIFAGIGFQSCSEGSDQSNDNVAYECPMKCEGEKVYTEEGACPVCGMDLVEI
tara:strand:+ start:1958 stop:2146 length:189 start_codon:yes stop_codon:yes gene_type:complete